MTIDRIIYNDEKFKTKNLVVYKGNFEHPWFYDNYRHRLMEDYSEEFVHLRAVKTGTIYQFKLDVMPSFRRECILITSTNKDTVYVFTSPKQPSFTYTLEKMEKAGQEKPSKTAYNGIVKYGGYIIDGYKKFKQGLDEADAEISEESLLLIQQSLYRRRKKYAKE